MQLWSEMVRGASPEGKLVGSDLIGDQTGKRKANREEREGRGEREKWEKNILREFFGF